VIDLLDGRPRWLVLAAVVLILYARRPDAFENPQFWAEDAMFFHADILWGPNAILVPYGGYLLLVPRLIAVLASLLDPLVIPATYMLSATLVTLYVCSRTWSPRFPLGSHVGYALAIVTVPDAFEVLVNVANVQWIIACGFVLLLISRDPETPVQRAHDTIAAVLCGLTGPFSVLFAPLFVVRLWQRRSTWSGVLALLVVSAAAIQAYLILENPQPSAAGANVQELHGLATVGNRIGGSLFLGVWLPASPPLPLGVAIGIATLVGSTLLAVRPGVARRERVLMTAAGLLVLVSGLVRCRDGLPALSASGHASRYFFAYQLVCLWLIVSLLDSENVRARVGGFLLVSLFLAVNVPRLRERPLQDYRWADYVDRIRAGEEVVVPVNPEGWKIPLSRRPRP
jgi:hypothetical protein